MKLSYLLAAALIAGLTFASTAQAASVDVTSATKKASYDVTATGTGSLADSLGGSLASDTEITINYDFKTGTPATLTIMADGQSKTATVIDLVTVNSGVVTTLINSSTNNIIATANFVNGVASVIIKNLTSLPITYSGTITASAGSSATVTYFGSAVPLPPAAILFLAGLIALAGFSMYKKARNQA